MSMFSVLISLRFRCGSTGTGLPPTSSLWPRQSVKLQNRMSPPRPVRSTLKPANIWCGFKVAFPLFDSGLRSGAIARASSQRLKAEARRTALRNQIEQQVLSAVAELQSAKIRVETFRQSVAEAQLALLDEQKKYDVGKSTINDLLDAEAAKLIADSQFSQALHEQLIAISNLKLAAGIPLLNENAKNKTRKQE